jgi:hypothetical protein
MFTWVRAVCSLVIGGFLLASPFAGGAEAQYFGRNKVEYRDFDFKTLRTEHFDIYYYPREEQAVREAARMAERWYARLSRVLDHRFTSRQPLILYGSHPEFSQTNVISQFLDESVGGVTEFVRRRIVMPFAAGLAETDHVLGHEIVHAFQIDIIKKQKRRMVMPLWFAEGMAEYLSLGSTDSATAAWVRDAVEHGDMPSFDQLDDRGVSPYRFGQALWAYLAGRFGDDFIRQVLHSAEKGTVLDRIARVAAIDASKLSDEWHQTVQRDFAPVIEEFRNHPQAARPLIAGRPRNRLNLGPSISPDGREVVFLSEKDQLSVDIFVADVATGAITRKLLTRSADQHLESLQFVTSAGAWDPTGRRFVISVVRGGVPVLLIFDVRSGAREAEIRLPELGEIFTPTWSPDGDSVAFAALDGGLTDLYVYDLKPGRLKKITNDSYTDLQPAWSPDGRELAFVTDRFSSDLGTLRFGQYQLALLNLHSREIRRLPAFDRVKAIDPHWAPDGSSLYFVSAPSGISNVFRLDLATSAVFQISDVATGVMGLTPSSPSLSVARSASTLAYSVFRHGKYEIHVLDSPAALAGRPPSQPSFLDADLLPPHRRESRTAELNDPMFGLLTSLNQSAIPYVPTLSLEGFGQPYVSSGGSRFGTFVRGGTSFLFGDVLGERKLGAALQVGTKQEDFAVQMRYLNRERRWNWGTTAEILPHVRGGWRRISTTESGQPVFNREIELRRQMHARVGGEVSYPFSRAQRIVFGGGLRHITSARQIRSRVFSSTTRKLIRDEERELSSERDATLAEASVALVHDSAIWGPASPILGTRSRMEVRPGVGGLSLTSVLADYRRYFMPLRPYTIATRLQYTARHGRDANDVRLQPLFVAYRHLVRGYDVSALSAGCASNIENECAAIDKLTGSRSLVANLELRFPIAGMFSRTQSYGRIPLEGVLFADGGLAGGGAFVTNWHDRLARSVGAAVRIAPFGFIAEIGAARTFDHPHRRWSLLLDFRPGF